MSIILSTALIAVGISFFIGFIPSKNLGEFSGHSLLI
jgi:hypothetical protein